MESCQAEMKQQNNLVIFENSGDQNTQGGDFWTRAEQKVMGRIRLSSPRWDIWRLIRAQTAKKTSERAGTCSKPCTTTLKCLQPSLHEGCQGLHSNTDQGTSLLSVCVSREIM